MLPRTFRSGSEVSVALVESRGASGDGDDGVGGGSWAHLKVFAKKRLRLQ